MWVEGRTRAERIEAEELIDVQEWAEVRGRAVSLAMPMGVSRDLWDVIETLPFGVVGERHVDERVEALLSAAGRALQRARVESPWLDPGEFFSVSFAAPLPGRSSDAKWRACCVVCGPDETGEVVLTIGLAEAQKSLIPVAAPPQVVVPEAELDVRSAPSRMRATARAPIAARFSSRTVSRSRRSR
jgi:hypothetical protein